MIIANEIKIQYIYFLNLNMNLLLILSKTSITPLKTDIKKEKNQHISYTS